MPKFLSRHKREIPKIGLKKSQKIASYSILQKDELTKKLIELEPNLPSPSYLLYNNLFPFYDTTNGESVSNTISLINLNSIKDFSDKINKDIEFERFRGNIYVQNLKAFEERGYQSLPICIAKTQYSFSTDPNLKGAPSGHVLPIREVRLSSGAEFVVVVCGAIMTMPGLPKVPAADSIRITEKGETEGLF